MGCWVGRPNDLMKPDKANPAGYWEHNAVVALNRAALQAIDCSWFQRVELTRFPRAQWDRLTREARAIAASFDQHGTWVAKDPRMVLLFPLWRQVLQSPVCIMIWRDPIAVARSLAERDRFPLRFGIFLWELYVRTMLSATTGLPRILVSYGELLESPRRTSRLLQTHLTECGVTLRTGAYGAATSVIRRALDRSSAAGQDYLLRKRHRDLMEALRDRTALSWVSVDPMPAAAAAELDALSARWRGRRV